MENLCRLCLRDDITTEDIFSLKDGLEIAELVTLICPITIQKDEDDQLPKSICNKCLEVVLAACELREQSVKSEQYLMQKLGIIKYETEEYLEDYELTIKTEYADEPPIEFADSSNFYQDPRPFGCAYNGCGSRFQTQDNAERHFKKVHGGDATPSTSANEVVYSRVKPRKKEQKKQCPICERYYSNSRCLRNHIENIHGNPSGAMKISKLSKNANKSSFQCDFCHLEMSSKLEMELHLKNVHSQITNDDGEKRFECSLCLRKLKKARTLEKHLRLFHNMFPGDALHCDLCDFFATKLHLMEVHMVKCHLLKEFFCKTCDRYFDRESQLKDHQLLHSDMVQELDQNQLQVFLCSLCHFNSMDRDELNHHLLDHMDAFGENPIACNKCAYVNIVNYEHFVNHTDQHNRRLTHRCLYCNRDFIADEIFFKHVKAHMNRQKMLFDCQICFRKFKTAEILTTHMVDHKNHKKHICPYCGKGVKHKTTFEYHVLRHEGKSGKHKCSLCTQSYYHLSKLKKHMMTHTNERPFQCHLCSKAFFDSNVLKKHIDRHQGTLLKRFSCEYAGCDKRFTSNWAKDSHFRTHSGEKPFVCQYCTDRSYAQKGDLMKHLKSHIGELVHKCDHIGCNQSFKYHQEMLNHKMVHLN